MLARVARGITILFGLIILTLLASCTTDATFGAVEEEAEELSSTSDSDENPDNFVGDFDDADDGLGDGVDSLDADGTSPSSRSLARNGSCSELIEGPPVGIACLHCGEPKAAEQSIKIAEIMAKSCRKNIATAMLVDGTFSDDQVNLKKVINTATKNGSTLHLYLYHSNGPWQRRWKTVPRKGVGTKMSPEVFRDRIHWDRALQEEYKQRVEWALPLIRHTISKGGVVSVMPMLEDNLDKRAARKMEELTLEAIPPTVSVALGRNPCTSCYSGNDGSVPEGLFLDQHVSSAGTPIRASNGLVTNDGKSFNFPHESSNDKDMSFSDMKTLIRKSLEKNNAYVIWRADYQGIHGGGLKDPPTRNYTVPTAEDEERLIELIAGEDSSRGLSGSRASSSSAEAGFSTKKVKRFLWKPESERDGNLVVLVDQEKTQVTVEGASFVDFGPSNDRGTTARTNKSGCAFGSNVRVELLDEEGLPMKLADGTYPIIVSNGCNRDDRNMF